MTSVEESAEEIDELGSVRAAFGTDRASVVDGTPGATSEKGRVLEGGG